MCVEESVQINRPVEEVFSYVADPENLPEWSGTVLEVQKGEQGTLREGDTFTVVAKFLGRRLETPMEITTRQKSSRQSSEMRRTSRP